MKITIFGSGYVGLVSGAGFAKLGHEVLCVDINATRIKQLQQGKIPIYEPGLETLIQTHHQKNLFFSDDVKQAIHHSQVHFICVNTPTIPGQGADISNILKVAENLAASMNEYKLIINKSTAPVGTVHKIQQLLEETLKKHSKQIDFDVASNPEFLKEGAAVKDFLEPDRIILGTRQSRAQALLAEIYSAFKNRLVFMDIASAELCKYAANAMLATKISFMNEMANIAEKVGADIEQVKYGISLDPRIGPHFINPGCGYGGSCFPKDVRALSHLAREHQLTPHILDAVETVNEAQKQLLFAKLERFFQGKLADKTIAVWGLAFKPNTDDMREASSVTLIHQLLQAGAKVQAYDPVAVETARAIYANQANITLGDSAEAVLNNADALVVVTEWDEFKKYDVSRFKTFLRRPLVFDGRNIYLTHALAELGVEYYSVGRL